MNKKIYRIIGLTGLGLIMAVLFQNCGNTNFAKTSKVGSGNPSTGGSVNDQKVHLTGSWGGRSIGVVIPDASSRDALVSYQFDCATGSSDPILVDSQGFFVSSGSFQRMSPVEIEGGNNIPVLRAVYSGQIVRAGKGDLTDKRVDRMYLTVTIYQDDRNESVIVSHFEAALGEQPRLFMCQ